MLWLIDLIGLT